MSGYRLKIKTFFPGGVIRLIELAMKIGLVPL